MRLCTAILLSSCAWGATSGDVRLLDAVKNQDRPAVRNLVKQRAGLQAADEDGTTALIWAAHNDDMETVKLLIAAGAHAKIANRYGGTALSETRNTGQAEMITAPACP